MSNSNYLGIYRNKIGPTFKWVFAFVFIVTIFQLSISRVMSWIDYLLVITVLILIFSLVIFYLKRVTYSITDEGDLTINGSLFHNRVINIQSISSISKTKASGIISVAASIDKLAIRYDGYRTILVSPDDSKSFIEEILEFNPQVNVRE